MNISTLSHGRRLIKTLVVMKLTVLLIILACFKVSATAYAQGITLNEKNASFAKVLKQIEKQSGYIFFYNNNLLKQARPVSISLEKVPLMSALEKCFANQPLTYQIIDNTIIVKIKEKTPIQKLKEVLGLPINIKGRITDTAGRALAGAVVKVKGSNITVSANTNGEFEINGIAESSVLVVTYIGYVTAEIAVNELNNTQINIVLKQSVVELDSINVISTGYQSIPKERATGSFVQIDNGLLNRAVSTNILDRLDGITNGLVFNKSLPNTGNNSAITIRGRSTIFSNADPLLVVDNFPYDGNINNINPADVESITVLKDAAAASIWGVRAGNGVIVITTKKGGYNSNSRIAFSTNQTIGRKPDLYYLPQISSSEYIDNEIFLFKNGKYDAAINSGYAAISEVVDILQRRGEGKITSSDSALAIDHYKSLDNRGQINKHLYRNSFNQQYQLNIGGGGNGYKYFLSGSYDRNLASQVSNKDERVTINANNTWQVLKKKGELFAGMTFTNTRNQYNNFPYLPTTPYEMLSDDSGNNLPVFGGRQAFRKSYVDTAGRGYLLDWNYVPLNENNPNTKNNNTDFRANTNFRYQLLTGLNASANYQYEKGFGELSNLNEENSFFTRDLINTYSSINDQTLTVNRIIPLGAILNRTLNSFNSHYGRLQLNLEKTINSDHLVTALAGFEIKDLRSDNSVDQYYGYYAETANNQNLTIDPTALHNLYYDSNAQGKVPFLVGQQWAVDRYRSYYMNGSYEYKNRIVVSASARKDESNLFGVKSNQKGVPLWSAGILYKISNDRYYKSSWLPQMSVRGTYGYNGNVNKSVSALLTSSLYIVNPFNTQYSQIINPPNPALIWEKVKNLNFGIDFSVKDQILSGSIEYYHKKGEDLIGNAFIAPQTGIYQFKGNTAGILTKGWDIRLSSHIIDSKFKWYADFLYSYTSDNVIKYGFKQPSNLSIAQSNPQNPLEGYPYYALFSFKYKGLDNTGNPIGYLNGEESKNYGSILNSPHSNELVYSGSATPKSFGSFRNTISYGPAEFSFNISYKLGYFFRRSSINYTTLYLNSNTSFSQADYASRWQKPGDETTTNVPGQIYPADSNRDQLYLYSTALIEKADHIRLRDIRFSYTFMKIYSGLKNLKAIVYASNLGIIWKATKYDIDPDYAFNSALPQPFMLSGGISFNLE